MVGAAVIPSGEGSRSWILAPIEATRTIRSDDTTALKGGPVTSEVLSSPAGFTMAIPTALVDTALEASTQECTRDVELPTGKIPIASWIMIAIG